MSFYLLAVKFISDNFVLNFRAVSKRDVGPCVLEPVFCELLGT
jgi:hypothetical protein